MCLLRVKKISVFTGLQVNDLSYSLYYNDNTNLFLINTSDFLNKRASYQPVRALTKSLCGGLILFQVFNIFKQSCFGDRYAD